MKRPFINIIWLMPLFFVACMEFISPNISGLTIPIQSPPDSLFTDREMITFRWEASELAEKYHFQLSVQENAQEYLLLDTLLTENTIRLGLEEGSYSWQLRARNESSASPFISRRIFIDQSPPMLPQAIFPMPGDSLSPEEGILQWTSGDRLGASTLAVQDSVYLYQWKNGWPVLRKAFEVKAQAEKAIPFSQINTNGYQLSSGEYRWEIKSFDRVGNSSCSRLFNFFYDEK